MTKAILTRLGAVLPVAALLCAFSVPARAASLESSGELRVRGWWLDNYLQDKRSTEFWDQRLRVMLNWPVAQNVKVAVQADIGEGFWGEHAAVSRHVVTGADFDSLMIVEVPPQPFEVRQQILFDQAFMQFIWPGTPLRFTVGRQEVSWGTGYWTQADYRDRLQVGARLDPWVVAVAYDKFAEVFTRHAALDDTRGWAIGAMTDAAGFKLGLLAAYLKDGSRVRFPAGDLSYGGADVFAKGRLGAASLNAELFYGTGTIDNDSGMDTGVGGLGAYVGTFVPAGPVTLGLEGAYARGDDPRTPGNEGLFSADYEGPYRSVIFYNGMDYPGYAADPQTSDTVKDFSVRNAVTGKVSATYSPARRLSVTAAALYAASDQTRPGVAKAMGWEVDLVAVYGLTESVSLTAGVGYAILGDYWRSAAIAGGTGARPDDPLGAVVAFAAAF